MGYPLAYILFAVGTLIAISGAAKLPEQTGGWPDTLAVFIVGAVISAAGLVLWRYMLAATKKAAVKAEADSPTQGGALELLAGVLEPARTLQAEIDKLDGTTITQRIDVLLETYVLPFAEVRQTVIDRFGMAKGAEILITVAYGERMLNRVWSAASDGHLPEAMASLPEAIDALDEAHQLAQAA